MIRTHLLLSMCKELTYRQALGMYDTEMDTNEKKMIEEQASKIDKAVDSVYDLKQNIILNSYALTDEERGDYMVYEVKHRKDIRPVYVSRELFMLLKEVVSNE